MSALLTESVLRRALSRLARVDIVRAVALEPRRATASEGLGDAALMAATSLWREVHGEMHAELDVAAPNWPRVRALHGVERAARAHMEAILAARRAVDEKRTPGAGEECG